jgi:hypothetical protein
LAFRCPNNIRLFLPQVLSWPLEMYHSDPMVAALHGLFAALEGQERERLAAGAGAGAGAGQEHGLPQRNVVNPNPLREALSALPGRLFTVGECLLRLGLGWSIMLCQQ